MPRLFFAVPIPDDIRRSLQQLQRGVEGAEWSLPENLHITLRFLGDVSEAEAERIKSRLKDFQFEKFSLSLSSLKTFLDSNGKPVVLWAGVKVGDALKDLKELIGERLKDIQLAQEIRAEYVPHITLARLDKNTGAVTPYLGKHNDLGNLEFVVDSFVLFESTGKPEVPYKRVQEYPAKPLQKKLACEKPKQPPSF
jgi:2'-5' RNA ligase